MPSPGTTGLGLMGVLSLAILPGATKSIRAQEETGAVQFQISCGPESQARFDRGATLLHFFQWEEAGEVFREIVARDSTCVIAEWGLAMALRGNPFSGEPSKANLREAWSFLSDTTDLDATTPRERGYLEALSAYFRNHDHLDHRARSLTHEVKMRELTQRYPDDLEAKVWYARAAVTNAIISDATLERRTEIGTLLEALLAEHPAHPGISHYLIHAYDHPDLAHRGLDAARRFTRIAPPAHPARHIPSYIFARLGLWDDVIEADLSSLETSHDVPDSAGAEVVPGSRFEVLDFLTYAYLQQGRDEEARKAVKAATRLRASTPDSSLAEPARYARATVSVRYALERRDWAGAANLKVLEDSEFPPAEAVTRFARALGAARHGDLETTRAEFERLLAIERSLPATQAHWRRRIEAQRLAVSAWASLAEGDTTNAAVLAAEAADREDSIGIHPGTPGPAVPARELLGDVLLEMGRYEDARTAYGAALRVAPNRARSLFGSAWAAQLLGDHDAAADWFKRYVTLTNKGDGDRPELAVAEAYVQGYARRR